MMQQAVRMPLGEQWYFFDKNTKNTRFSERAVQALLSG